MCIRDRNEKLKSGKVVLERTGGPNDSSSPHEISLIDIQLQESSKISVDITQQANLVSNAVYRVSLVGLDIAGNEGISNVIDDVTFDDIPPEISVISPAAESFINSPVIGLRSNETLNIASVDWIWQEGEEDTKKEYTSNLVGGTLDEGEYPQVKFDPEPSLTSGAWYAVTFNGTDRAGNSAIYNHGRLFFDNSPPVLLGKFPQKKKFYDCILVAVPHQDFKEFGYKKIKSLGTSTVLFYDLKETFPDEEVDFKL